MMIDYLLRRLALLAFMLFTLTLFTFSLSYLFPGEVLTNLSGISTTNPAELADLKSRYHLDDNYLNQYLAFLFRIIDGDWGLSFASGSSVYEHILTLAPATLELSLYALFISVIVGLPCGIIAALFHRRWADKLIRSITLVGYSVPIFWLALLLIMVFCLTLGWLPMSGRISLLYEIPANTEFILLDIALAGFPYQGAAFVDALQHLTLPTLVLATYPTTVLIRFTRDSMLTVLDKQYIKTAQAKGLSKSQLITRHALRNALLPVIQQIGLQFSALITLAMITESIFSWPGVGRWVIDSIYQRDFPAIQGGLLAISLFVIFATILADLLHTLLDPISRNQSHGKT